MDTPNTNNDNVDNMPNIPTPININRISNDIDYEAIINRTAMDDDTGDHDSDMNQADRLREELETVTRNQLIPALEAELRNKIAQDMDYDRKMTGDHNELSAIRDMLKNITYQVNENDTSKSDNDHIKSPKVQFNMRPSGLFNQDVSYHQKLGNLCNIEGERDSAVPAHTQEKNTKENKQTTYSSVKGASDTLKRQLSQMNDIYARIDSAERRELKLCDHQAEMMQSIEDIPDDDKLDKLSKIQSSMKGLREYKNTLDNQLSDYISKEFNIETPSKEDGLAKSKLDIYLPSGTGAKPSLVAAHKLKNQMNLIFSRYTKQLGALIPLFQEITGANSNMKESSQSIRHRWASPCFKMRIKDGNSTTPSYDTRVINQNQALFKILESQDYSSVHSFFGLRSIGTSGNDRIVTEGRVDDALSILGSCILFNESYGYTTREAVRSKISYARGLFRKGSVSYAIKQLRRLLERAAVMNLRIDYHSISQIASTLCARSSLYCVYLAKWVEAPESIEDEGDCLHLFNQFLMETDMVSQQLSLVDVPNLISDEHKQAYKIFTSINDTEDPQHKQDKHIDNKRSELSKYTSNATNLKGTNNFTRNKNNPTWRANSKPTKRYNLSNAKVTPVKCAVPNCNKMLDSRTATMAKSKPHMFWKCTDCYNKRNNNARKGYDKNKAYRSFTNYNNNQKGNMRNDNWRDKRNINQYNPTNRMRSSTRRNPPVQQRQDRNKEKPIQAFLTKLKKSKEDEINCYTTYTTINHSKRIVKNDPTDYIN